MTRILFTFGATMAALPASAHTIPGNPMHMNPHGSELLFLAPFAIGGMIWALVKARK